jgi:hypothetical protein
MNQGTPHKRIACGKKVALYLRDSSVGDLAIQGGSMTFRNQIYGNSLANRNSLGDLPIGDTSTRIR